MLGAGFTASCTLAPRGERDTDAALRSYVQALKSQDTEALVALFEEDATMGHEGQALISGRSGIASFLNTFKDYKVISHEMKVLAVSVRGTTAVQNGTYEQSVRTPEGQQVHVAGTFIFEWRQQRTGKWLIHRARTASAA